MTQKIKNISPIALLWVIALTVMMFTNNRYDKNMWLGIPFLMVLPLMGYWLILKKWSFKNILKLTLIISLLLGYLYLIPDGNQILFLAFVAMPVLLWAIVAYVYTEGDFDNLPNFIRYSFELFFVTAALTIIFFIISLSIPSYLNFYHLLFDLPVFVIPLASSLMITSRYKKPTKVLHWVGFSIVLIVFSITFLIINIGLWDPFYTYDRISEAAFSLILLSFFVLYIWAYKQEDSLTNFISGALIVVGLIAGAFNLYSIINRLITLGFTPIRLAVLGSNLIVLLFLFLAGRSLFTKRILWNIQPTRLFGVIVPAGALILLFIFPLVFYLFPFSSSGGNGLIHLLFSYSSWK